DGISAELALETARTDRGLEEVDRGQPDLLAELALLGDETPALRLPHTQDVPQGSRPVSRQIWLALAADGQHHGAHADHRVPRRGRGPAGQVPALAVRRLDRLPPSAFRPPGR